jgi:hypothetical protein
MVSKDIGIDLALLINVYRQALLNGSEEITKLIIDTQNAVRNGR